MMRWRIYEAPSIFIIDKARCAPAHREEKPPKPRIASGGFSLRALPLRGRKKRARACLAPSDASLGGPINEVRLRRNANLR